MQYQFSIIEKLNAVAYPKVRHSLFFRAPEQRVLTNGRKDSFFKVVKNRMGAFCQRVEYAVGDKYQA